MGTGGDAAGHLLQQRIGIDAEPLGNQFFFSAEGVTKPAHGQAGKEADRFRLRHAGNHVRINANIHLRIGAHLRQVDHLLPESAAEYRSLPGAHHPKAQTAELDVAAAHHYRRPGAQAALLRRRFGDGAQQGTGLFDRRQHIGAQPGHIQQRRTPVAAEQVEHAGGAGV